MTSHKKKSNVTKVEIIIVLSQFAILCLCLFIIFSPIAFLLTNVNLISQNIINGIAYLFLYLSFSLSLITFALFITIFINKKSIITNILGENAQYFLITLISFIISFAFIIIPIILPSN